MISSPFAKTFFRLFGSMKLAVVTLTLLAAILITATIVESKTSTRQAQALFYQSGWFLFLVAMLAVNVFCAAMLRYPWKSSQLGFVMTHMGILTVLAGAIVGMLFGVEGSLTLVEGGPARSSINRDYEVLRITPVGQGESLALPLNLEKHPLRPGETRKLSARSLDLGVVLKAHHRHTREELVVTEGGVSTNPAVRFTFASKVGTNAHPSMAHSEWLIAGDPERKALDFGSALFRIEAVASEAALSQRLRPPAQQNPDGKGALVLSFGSQKVSVPVSDFLGKEYKSADGQARVLIREYFADFRMDTETKKPMSVSDVPHNPAVSFEATLPAGDCVGFVFADFPQMGIVRGTNTSPGTVQALYEFDRSGLALPGHGAATTVTVLVGPQSQLHYVTVASPTGFQTGELKVGQAVVPGWKLNAELRVDEVVERPRLSTRILPAEPEPDATSTAPALEVEVTRQNQTQTAMVRWGQPSQVVFGNTRYEMTFDYDTFPLGFSVQLLQFASPKYEGTEIPAGYESQVRVTHLKSGDAFETRIWMNHPLTYGGFRISQSGYREGEGAAQSTLGFLRDPGWPFKWAGSFLLMIGLLVMFYFKPRPRAGVARSS